jgi:hypothetical protein
MLTMLKYWVKHKNRKEKQRTLLESSKVVGLEVNTERLQVYRYVSSPKCKEESQFTVF